MRLLLLMAADLSEPALLVLLSILMFTGARAVGHAAAGKPPRH